MNKAILVGRLTRDPELKTTASGTNVCSFSIAVNRRYRNAEGNYDTDFINCTTWRQTAEFVSKYFTKGRMIGVVGSIQTRNYDGQDGKKVYVTEVAVDEAYFVESKGDNNTNPAPVADVNDFAPIDDTDELPFS